MYKVTLTTLAMFTALLHAAGAAQAQAPNVDIAPDCSDEAEDAGKVEKIMRALEGAFQRLADVDNLVNSAPADFNAAFAKAFGKYEPGTDASEWAGIAFVLYHANIRPLLTNTSGVTISSGPAPTWPRVGFRCAKYDFSDIAAERNSNVITLYPVFFDDARVPNTQAWDRGEGSRVGTILHESVHLLGAPADVRDDGRNQDVQAEKLAADRDSRALTNAANYEMFYMSFPFQR